jgi:penicillin-binding protein 1A
VGMMNAMLQETLITGTGRRAELKGWQAAGKTGTSQEYRDGWFVGYTSQMVAGVWLGNDDASPTKRISGGNLPADIWARFMREGLRGTTETPLPGVAEWRAAPLPAGATAAVRNTPLPGAATGQPVQLGGGTAPSGPGRSNDLLPPAEVGRAAGPAPRERGLLERLLGG